jgi:hypothetical protein
MAMCGAEATCPCADSARDGKTPCPRWIILPEALIPPYPAPAPNPAPKPLPSR